MFGNYIVKWFWTEKRVSTPPWEVEFAWVGWKDPKVLIPDTELFSRVLKTANDLIKCVGHDPSSLVARCWPILLQLYSCSGTRTILMVQKQKRRPALSARSLATGDVEIWGLCRVANTEEKPFCSWGSQGFTTLKKRHSRTLDELQMLGPDQGSYISLPISCPMIPGVCIELVYFG